MRWLAALLLAACASPESPPQCSVDEALALAPADAQESVEPAPVPVPPAATPPPWQAAPPVAMPAPPVQPAAAGAVVAPPSEAMRAVAVAADGGVAVSADVSGNVRLWPALDGTVEPVVVAMRRPVALAITRAGNNLEIAGVDGAGQLEIVQVGPFGEPQGRTPVELPRPVIDVRATETGFLVETDDQKLAFVDLGARLAGEVEPPPGTDIAAITVSRDRMLALLSGGGAVHGRWLVVNGALQWGQETAALPLAPGAIALSPDATMLAGLVENASSARLAIVGIEHADLRAVATDDQVFAPDLRPLRWLDDTTVLTTATDQLFLWHRTGDSLNVTGLAPGPAATEGGATAVIGAGTELMLVERSGMARFLGFRMPGFASLAASGRSLVASDGRSVIRLGENLREYASYDVGSLYAPESASVISLIDSSHVLVQSYSSVTHLDVVALDTLDAKSLDEAQWLGYDATTHLAAFLAGTVVHFRRFDASDGTFGPAAELKTETAGTTVVFTDDGAFVTTSLDGGSVTRTVTNIRPEHGTLVAKRSRLRPFTETNAPVFGPAAPPFWRTVKNPDGTLAARLGSGRISLRDAEGNVQWTVPARGAYDLVWLASGELLAIGAGIARIDVDTGALTERRCGWEFGLWPQKLDTVSSATLCEAE